MKKRLIKLWRFASILLLLIYLGFVGPWLISAQSDIAVIAGLITGAMLCYGAWCAVTYQPKDKETSL